MKRKIFLIITAILVLALAIPAVAAVTAMTDQQKNKVSDLQKQIADLQKQKVDVYVEAGQITADQAKTIKANIDQRLKYQAENGYVPGPGFGKGGCGGGNGSCGMGGGGRCGGGSGAWGTQAVPNTNI